MKARDVMSRPVVSIRPETSVREAITLLTDKGFAALPVVDDLGQVVGIFSESDGLRASAAGGNGRLDQAVDTAMAAPVEVAGPGTDIASIAERMLAGRLRCVPVVEEGLLIGVVARRDLLRTMVRDDDVIAAKVRALLDDYAGSRRQWTVEIAEGNVVVGGEFADEAERSIVAALTRTIAGVVGVELRPTTGISLGWTD